MPGAVLLVDDERFSRTIYSDYLRSAGYEVAEADSAETALEAMRLRRFDLLVTDLIMPGTNGIELLSEAKRLDPSIETLVVTSINRVDAAVRAMKSGASDYLVKPVTPEALQVAAQSCLSGRALLARNKALRSHLQLFDTCQRLSASLDHDRAVALALDAIQSHLQAEACVFLRRDPKTPGFRLAGQVGIDPATARHVAAQVSEGIPPPLPTVGNVRSVPGNEPPSPDQPPPAPPTPSSVPGNDRQPGGPPAGGSPVPSPVPGTGRDGPVRMAVALPGAAERATTLLVLAVTDDEGSRGAVGALIRTEPDAQQVRSAEFICSHLSLALRTLGHLQRVEHLAYLDDLTKLYNTRFLDLVLDREIAAGRAFTVLFLDLDRFKLINDQHGHLVGSKLLVEVGRVLKACVRDEDVVARYGGDEYAAVLLGIDSGGALKVAERIRRSIEDHSFLSREGSRIRVTASIGLASYPEHASRKSEVLDLADRAMYRGKRSTRNVVYIASRDLPPAPTR